MSLPNLKLSLIVEALDRATEPLRKVGEGLKGVGERVERLEAGLHKLGLAEFLGGAFFTGAVVEAGKSIWELTNKTAEYGEAALHAAQKAGTSVESIQRLQFAAKQLGVDQDALSHTFFLFQTHLANAVEGNKEARGALKLLGISMKDLKTLSRDPQEAFLRLVDGITRIKNPTERAKVAMDLFSRGGYQMLPMLSAGREEIEKFMGQLDAAHGVMTTEDAKASEAYIQSKNRMSDALDGLQRQIGVKLLPAFTQFNNKVTDTLEHIQPKAIQSLTASITALLNDLPPLLPHFVRLLDLVTQLADGMAKLAQNTLVVKSALAVLGVVVGVQLLIGFAQLIATIAGGVVAFTEFVGVVSGLLALTAGIQSFADVIALLDLAFAANPVGMFILAVTALAGLAVLVVNNWTPISGFFGGLLNTVEKVFKGAWERIEALTPPWLKALLHLGGQVIRFDINSIAAPGGSHAPGAPAPLPAGAPAGHGGAPAAAGGVARPGGRGATPDPAVAHVHLHVTSDGKTQVKRASASGAALTIDRGRLPE
ncbi:MAG TPA: hypothetical protein VMU59_11430 [Caulobacteraceae bacterium]|nr:hypothetical protein [Caulobacteraceae bacterium]